MATGRLKNDEAVLKHDNKALKGVKWYALKCVKMRWEGIQMQ